MTLLLPFLPIYVEQLGVTDQVAIVQWSGAAYGATFLTAALFAPLWGRLGDQYGRKLMQIRASLSMAIAMSLIGLHKTSTNLSRYGCWAPRMPGYPGRAARTT
jgi:MFS family permease